MLHKIWRIIPDKIMTGLFCSFGGPAKHGGRDTNYFEFAYGELTHGYIYLFANYLLAAGIPLALGETKRPRIKHALITAAEAIACVVVFELLAASYFTIVGNDHLIPFVCCPVVTTLYAVIRSKKKASVRVMRACLYVGIGSLGVTITMSMGAILGEPYYYLQWVMISQNAIEVFFAAFFARSLSVKDEIKCPTVFVTVIAVTGGLYWLFAVLRRQMEFDPAASIAVCVICIFLYVILYFAVGHVAQKSYTDARKQAIKIMSNAQKDALRLSNENIENMHRLRHDLKNHFAIMKTFVRERNYAKLEEYYSGLSEIFERTVEFPDCGNDTLNAIIAIELGRVKESGARLEYKASVPAHLDISAVDLCSLIMNLVSNAVEYYERAYKEAAASKTIDLEVSLINKTLLVKTQNDIAESDAENALKLETGKPDKYAHGFGTKIVAAIVEKYNGKIDYEVKDGKFIAAAMLFV